MSWAWLYVCDGAATTSQKQSCVSRRCLLALLGAPWRTSQKPIGCPFILRDVTNSMAAPTTRNQPENKILDRTTVGALWMAILAWCVNNRNKNIKKSWLFHRPIYFSVKVTECNFKKDGGYRHYYWLIFIWGFSLSDRLIIFGYTDTAW